MRLTAEPLIERAAEDDGIMELSVRAAMARFQLRADEVRAARQFAIAHWSRKRLLLVTRRVDAARIRRRVLSHAVAHPGVHRRLILEEWTCRHVADQYQINHAMAHIIRTDFKQLADLLDEPHEKLVGSIEKEARQPGVGDRVNKPRGSYIHTKRHDQALEAAKAARVSRRFKVS